MDKEEMAIKGMLKIVIHYADKTIESIDDRTGRYETDVKNLKEVRKDMKAASKAISQYIFNNNMKIVVDYANDVITDRNDIDYNELVDFRDWVEGLIEDLDDYMERLGDYDEDDEDDDDDEDDEGNGEEDE